MIEPEPTRSRAVWLWRIARAFSRRELREMFSYKMWMVTGVLGIAASAVSLVFFSRFIGSGANPHLTKYGGEYLPFALTGFLMAQLQYVGVGSLGVRIRSGQTLGTLEAELATPAPPWMVLSVAPIYEFVSAMVRTVVYMTGAALLLGVRFEKANFLSVVVAVPLILCAFAGLGLLTAAGTMLARRGNPVPAVLNAASLLLGGVAFPRSVLPPALQAAGEVLPLTHALEVLRKSLLQGASPGDLGKEFFYLLGFGIVLTPIGFLMFRYALGRARENGSLTHY